MDKETRKAIIISLVSSAIFLALVQPLLTFTWHWLGSASSSFSDSFSRHLYTVASHGNRNWVIVELGTYAIIVVMSIYITLLTVINMWIRKMAQEITNPVSTEKHTLDSLKVRVQRLKKMAAWIFPICGIGVLVASAETVVHYNFDLIVNDSFSQRLTILTPNVTQHQIDELRADWARMKNRGDYEKIAQHMDSLAKDAGIELPPYAMK